MSTHQQLETESSNTVKLLNDNQFSITTPIEIFMPVVDNTEVQGRARTYFIADQDYTVLNIQEVHDKQQTSADGCSLMVSKVTDTTAPESAVLHLITDTAFDGSGAVYKGFDLKGVAVHTVTGGTLTNQASSLTLAAGDRLVWGINGTISSTFITLTTALQIEGLKQ